MAFKKAKKKFDRGDYEVAIDGFGDAVASNYLPAESNYLIAESFRLSNRVKQAEPYYENAIGRPGIDPEARFYYGFALKANERYDQAQEQFEWYLANGDSVKLREWAQKEVENLQALKIIREEPGYYRVKNLEEINSPAPEYAPVYRDGELFYTSTTDNARTYLATGTGYTDLFKVKTEGAIVDMATAQPLDDYINDPIRNEGAVAFSPDGNMMVFAKGNSRKKKGGLEVNLYVSTFRNGEWTEPRLLSINNTKIPSWNSTPAFSRDGNTLYFASNRTGGYGGIDLYSARRTRRGDFVRVRNMGPQINTPGNELFPHVSSDGRMYFASDGHPGFGGLDIFVAERRSGRIAVENLGSSLNSSSDDFGLFLFSPTKGFFSSNREGGMGDDDIYTFVNNDPDLKIINYFLTGITYENTDSGTEVLANTRVQLFGQNGDLVEETVTGTDGKYLFRVYGDEDYILIADKGDYLTTREEFTTKGKSIPKERLIQLVTNKIFEKDITLEKLETEKIFALKNLYYDLDKDDIRPDAALVLDSLVQILRDNPEITIELSSHTDSRAPDDYNMDLSQRRAQSAVDYLVSRGIDPARLIAKGYGETQLINRCANNVECTEEEHQQNRRTEFKIVGIDKTRRAPASDEDDEDGIDDDAPANDVFDEDRYFNN